MLGEFRIDAPVAGEPASRPAREVAAPRPAATH
jgi:hypothetical protein